MNEKELTIISAFFITIFLLLFSVFFGGITSLVILSFLRNFQIVGYVILLVIILIGFYLLFANRKKHWSINSAFYSFVFAGSIILIGLLLIIFVLPKNNFTCVEYGNSILQSNIYSHSQGYNLGQIHLNHRFRFCKSQPGKNEISSQKIFSGLNALNKLEKEEQICVLLANDLKENINYNYTPGTKISYIGTELEDISILSYCGNIEEAEIEKYGFDKSECPTNTKELTCIIGVMSRLVK